MEGSPGFLGKAKAAMGQAAARAREEVDDLQARHELGNVERELGRTVLELVEAGELEHEALEEHVAKIRELRARLEGAEAEERAAEEGSAADDDAAAGASGEDDAP
jgi:hypothetical protein